MYDEIKIPNIPDGQVIYGDWLVKSPGKTYSEMIWLPDDVLEVLNSILNYSRTNPNNTTDIHPIVFWRARNKPYAEVRHLKIFSEVIGEIKCRFSNLKARIVILEGGNK